MIHIRHSMVEDIGSIAQCMKRFYDNSKYHQTGLKFSTASVCDFCYSLITNPGACLIIAEDQGMVVGFLTGVSAPWSLNYSQILASELGWWIDVDHRGGTVAFRLMKEYERWAKSVGATHCMMAHLEDDKSERLERFYEKVGYRKAESHYMKGL